MRRRWMREREDGASEVVLDGKAPEGDGWVLVPDELTAQVGAHPERYSASTDGVIQRRAVVRLSISKPRFAADGIDQCLVLVSPDGEEAEALTDIEISVNDEKITVQLREVVPIKTTTPGTYRIRVSDRRVYCEHTFERSTRAVDPEKLKEELRDRPLSEPIPARLRSQGRP